MYELDAVYWYRGEGDELMVSTPSMRRDDKRHEEWIKQFVKEVDDELSQTVG